MWTTNHNYFFKLNDVTRYSVTTAERPSRNRLNAQSGQSHKRCPLTGTDCNPNRKTGLTFLFVKLLHRLFSLISSMCFTNCSVAMPIDIHETN